MNREYTKFTRILRRPCSLALHERKFSTITFETPESEKQKCILSVNMVAAYKRNTVEEENQGRQLPSVYPICIRISFIYVYTLAQREYI